MIPRIQFPMFATTLIISVNVQSPVLPHAAEMPCMKSPISHVLQTVPQQVVLQVGGFGEQAAKAGMEMEKKVIPSTSQIIRFVVASDRKERSNPTVRLLRRSLSSLLAMTGVGVFSFVSNSLAIILTMSGSLYFPRCGVRFPFRFRLVHCQSRQEAPAPSPRHHSHDT